MAGLRRNRAKYHDHNGAKQDTHQRMQRGIREMRKTQILIVLIRCHQYSSFNGHRHRITTAETQSSDPATRVATLQLVEHRRENARA